MVVNLFHNRVESPRFAVVPHFRKRGPWRQNPGAFAHVQEDLFPGKRRILEAVVEVELLEQIVRLAGDEAVEVHLEGFLVAGVVHAGIALQPDAHRIQGGGVNFGGDGDGRGDVILLAVVLR